MKMASKLTKSDYTKTSLRAYLLQNGMNYNNYQGLGYANMLYPSLRKMYSDDDELKEVLKDNIEFFNTNPSMAPFITNLHLSMLDGGAPVIVGREVHVVEFCMSSHILHGAHFDNRPECASGETAVQSARHSRCELFRLHRSRRVICRRPQSPDLLQGIRFSAQTFRIIRQIAQFLHFFFEFRDQFFGLFFCARSLSVETVAHPVFSLIGEFMKIFQYSAHGSAS